ncbi:hypothetical protein [Hydrocarboniphaga effusa]|uniref:hypothetical protein n=1 Tax=Hydrocarboniphaga effusa TaxID=243629 RepID=UPI00398C0909
MTPFLRHFFERIWPVFAVDLRSLAVFRFGLGLLVFVDACGRFGDIGAFYGLDGLLPPSALAGELSDWRWSLHLVNHSTPFQALLILAQALAGLAIAAGLRTRLATLVAWVLAVSLCNRNPLVIGPGDALLCALLFWSLFLPLAGRWSIDATLGEAPPLPARLQSAAAVALTLQVLSPFFFDALHRGGSGDWAGWQRVFALESLERGLAPWLATHPQLLAALSAWSQWLQWLGPLLLMLPLPVVAQRFDLRGILRLLVLPQLALLVLLMLTSTALGLLSWLLLVGLSALIGSGFWEALERRRQLRSPTRLRVFYDDGCAHCRTACRLLIGLLLVDADLLPARSNRRADTLARANDSWVVFDRDDSAHLRGEALLLLIRRSPLLGWIGRWLARPALSAQADRLYMQLAPHHQRWARIGRNRWSSPAAAVRSGRWIVVATVLVLGGNLLGLAGPGNGLLQLLSPPLQLLRLDQRWDWFAPAMLREDAHWLAPGVLGNGTEADVLDPDPADDDIRWRYYEDRLAEPRHRSLLPVWAGRLCDEWNEGRPAGDAERLAEFKLIRVVRPLDARAQPEQRVLLRQQCTAPQ